MKMLHTADIHLREFEDERWKALQKLLEIGKRENVEVLLISGDLFDKDITAEKLRTSIRKIFSENPFKIVVIPGNHDAGCYKPGLYFGDHAEILLDVNRPFECGDVRIFGIPFEPINGEKVLNKLRLLKERLTTDKKNVILYHGELLDVYYSRSDFGDEGEERYMPVKFSYFRGMNIDYVLAGHFHSKFDVHELENGGYFVYPGSPISITKRETGRRKVNLFEVGGPPQEYTLDTPHFEEVVIDLEPFKHKDPVDVVRECLEAAHPRARIMLTIKGYVNSAEIEISESELAERIKQITKGKCEPPLLEFRDIGTILQDDLFKTFMSKLEQTGYSGGRKKQMWDMAINAMREARG